jgi:hypothetical protein
LKLLVSHPKAWTKSVDTRFSEIRHVSLGGETPRKRSGRITFDGYAEVVTNEGLEKLYRIAEEMQPEVFLFWMHTNFDAIHLKAFKEKSPKTKFIYWHGNHREQLTGSMKKYLGVVNHVLINSADAQQFELYESFGCKVGTLWDGFDPTEIEYSKNDPDYDCVFGGETYITDTTPPEIQYSFPGGGLRYEFVKAIADRFSTAIFSAFPQNWGDSFNVMHDVYHPGYTNALRRGKINLNVNHFPRLYKAYTRRTIRSIFSKRLHMTYYIPGMEQDFVNHSNIVWFNSIPEGIELVEYYLRHETEREAIAEAQYENAMKNFTFKNRLQQFEQVLKGWRI